MELFQKLMVIPVDLIYENVKYCFTVSKSGPSLYHLNLNKVRSPVVRLALHLGHGL